MRALLIALLVLGSSSSALAYDELPAFEGGTIRGTVAVKQAPPAKPPHAVHRDQDVCGASVPDETWVLGEGLTLGGVVVTLEGVTAGKPLAPGVAHLDQEGCRFVPHVQTVPVGTKLTMVSADSVMHSAHALDGGKSVFNLAMPIKGMKAKKKLKRSGRIRVQCDAGHTWMSAWVHVTPHPYAVVTGKDGAFVLEDVPPGEYVLKTWHEAAGETSTKVVVVARETAALDVSY